MLFLLQIYIFFLIFPDSPGRTIPVIIINYDCCWLIEYCYKLKLKLISHLTRYYHHSTSFCDDNLAAEIV